MRIASKWIKHRVLAENPSLRKHLPETQLYTNHSLWQMIARHRTVFLKPVVGTGGKGIIRIVRRNGACFSVQIGMNKYSVKSKQRLLRLIRYLTGLKQYLVQQGIDLISLEKRPLDYRLLILRPGSAWKIIGIMGKWAARGKIVTNHCRGGKPIDFQPSLKRSLGLSKRKCKKMENNIHALGRRVAETLGNHYRMRGLGLDIGIDKQKRIWLLEANTEPLYRLFRYHHNRALYPKIVRYMKQIGR